MRFECVFERKINYHEMKAYLEVHGAPAEVMIVHTMTPVGSIFPILLFFVVIKIMMDLFHRDEGERDDNRGKENRRENRNYRKRNAVAE